MSRLLIVYGTSEGHTARVAERMAAAIRGAGHQVELRDSNQIQKKSILGHFDGIIVGGSVHAGEHQRSLRDFVRGNRGLLEQIPSAFFSVSLSAAGHDEKAVADTQTMVDRFIRETGWRPAQVETVAGALLYTRYNFFMRYIMKRIVKSGGRTELDTSRDYDFTDWGEVDRFAVDFARTVASSVTAAA